MLRRNLAAAVTLLVGALGADGALAQDTDAAPGDEAAAQAALPDGAAAAAPDRGATGTRIRRPDVATAAPLVVIGREEIAASGKVRIGDLLQTLPLQGNAVNTQVNALGDGSTRVALRSLGPERTLVLVNGHRFVPGGPGADASVDLNAIPSNAIDRIEILAAGASAVYGSDAIAGVVNLVTREPLRGADVAAYAGTSSEGDGTTYDVSVSAGTAGDRGGVLFTAGYSTQQAIGAGDRGWSATPLTYDYRTRQATFAGSAATPAGLVELSPDTCTNGFCQQVFAENAPLNGGPFAGGRSYAFAPDPSFGATGFRLATGAPLYNFQPESHLVTPQRRVQLFATGDVRVAGAARAYVEAAYVNRRSEQAVAAEPLFANEAPFVVARDSLYNPFGHDLTFVARRLTELGRRTFEQDVDTFHVVGRVEGTLGDAGGALPRWRWDANVDLGRTQAAGTARGALRTPLLQSALGPSMIDPATGQPICVRVAGDAATRIGGCVPLDLLGGPGTITPAMVSSLAFTASDRGHDQLASVQVNASGNLFRLAADRPVAVAAGYEYRDVRGAFVPDPAVAAFETTLTAAPPAEGAYHANEVYAEVSVPIVSGRPGAQELEATLAARSSAYSTFGDAFTYTAGLRWRVFPDVTLRGTFSTAFRAPSIRDLYGGSLEALEAVSDPCAGPVEPGTPLAQRCGAAANNNDARVSHTTIFGGNPDLGPETADVLTAGLLVEPRAVPNLRVALDYHAIGVRDAIGRLGPGAIVERCYTAGLYCDRIHRLPNGMIDVIDDRDANAGRIDTSGLDLSIRWALATAIGHFGVGADAAWLRAYDEVLPDGTVVHGKGTYDLGVLPAYRLAAGATWAWKGLGAGLATRYVGSFDECAGPGGRSAGGSCSFEEVRAAAAGRAPLRRDVGAWATTDVFVSYAVAWGGGGTRVSLGAVNVLDEAPPVVYAAGTVAGMSDPTAYDYAGRFVYVRVAHAY